MTSKSGQTAAQMMAWIVADGTRAEHVKSILIDCLPPGAVLRTEFGSRHGRPAFRVYDRPDDPRFVLDISVDDYTLPGASWWWWELLDTEAGRPVPGPRGCGKMAMQWMAKTTIRELVDEFWTRSLVAS